MLHLGSSCKWSNLQTKVDDPALPNVCEHDQLLEQIALYRCMFYYCYTI